MLPIRIVPRPLDFRVTSLLANLLQRLSPEPQRVIHHRHALAPRFPLRFQRDLRLFQPRLLRAQRLELHRKLFVLHDEPSRLFADRRLLLLQSLRPPIDPLALLCQPRRQRFRRR